MTEKELLKADQKWAFKKENKTNINIIFVIGLKISQNFFVMDNRQNWTLFKYILVIFGGFFHINIFSLLFAINATLLDIFYFLLKIED